MDLATSLLAAGVMLGVLLVLLASGVWVAVSLLAISLLGLAAFTAVPVGSLAAVFALAAHKVQRKLAATANQHLKARAPKPVAAPAVRVAAASALVSTTEQA